MKKKFVWLFSVYFFLSSLVFANYKLAVLDFDRVFKDSVQYQKIIYSINYDVYKKYLFLNNEINKLIKEKSKYSINKNKINKIKFYFRNKEINIFNKINKLEEYINKKNFSIHNFFILKIKKIINSLIKDHKYDIIFDNNSLLYHNKNVFDITNIIIKKLD